jgi:hypothetical protein
MLNIVGLGKSIASFVKSDVYNKEILYVDDNLDHKDKALKKTIDDDEISFLLKKRNKTRRAQEIYKIKNAINKNIDLEDDELNKIKNKLLENNNQVIGKEIKIDNGFLQVIPPNETNKRQILYVCGASGSGKSYFSAKYCKAYKQLYPDRNIYIFSKLDDDAVLDELDPIRIDIDTIADENIELENYRNSLIIFDDTDTISDKAQRKAINQIKADVLELGRHFNISAIITSHLITNYRESRTILNETHILVVYPKSGSSYQINYALKNYCGFGKEDLQKIFKIESRWVAVFKNYPMCVVYEKGAYIL